MFYPSRLLQPGEKEPPLLFGDNFLLYLFFIYGGHTFTFYAIFFYMIKKNNIFKARTFIISFFAIFTNLFAGFGLAVDDNTWLPYYIYFPTINYGLGIVIKVTFVNYVILLILSGVIYWFTNKIKVEQDRFSALIFYGALSQMRSRALSDPCSHMIRLFI